MKGPATLYPAKNARASVPVCREFRDVAFDLVRDCGLDEREHVVDLVLRHLR
jgi:hypothetical protein